MSNDPQSTEPEYLGAAPPPSGDRPKRRGAAIAVAAVGAAAAVGVGGWAAVSFLGGGGAQPSAAIPADAIAYVSVDLDPSASQKMEAVSIVKKFPGLDKELGWDAKDDLRRWIFEESDLAACEGVDYAEDVEPWLGERAAVAVLPAAKDGEEPRPLFALQVTDEEIANDKLAELVACEKGEGSIGFAVSEGHALLAETTEIAESAATAAAEASLADDESFDRWTGEVGDPGIITAYVAPGAPAALVEMQRAWEKETAGVEENFFTDDPEAMPINPMMPGAPMDADEVEEMTKDFDGMAAVVRFADGAVEAEFAASGLPEGYSPKEAAGTAIGELPDTTGLAFALAFPDDWLEGYLESMATMTGEDMSLDEMWAEGERATGLTLPEDLETLLGDSVSVAVDASMDSEVFMAPDPSGVPAGIRISGDPAEIMPVVDKIKEAMGPDAELMKVEQGDGAVALGFGQEYVAELAGKGSLADDPVFQGVVPEPDKAGGVFFLSFDAGDSWVERLTTEAVASFEAAAPGMGPNDSADTSDVETKIQENMEALEAFGVSSWIDGEVQRGLLRLTTD